MSNNILNVTVQGNVTLANNVLNRLYQTHMSYDRFTINYIKSELKDILIEVCRYDLIYLKNHIFITSSNPFFDEVMEVASDIGYIRTTKDNDDILKITIYDDTILEEFLCYQSLKNPDKVYESYWDFESDIDVY